jgi:hypothetical protein
MFKFRMNFTGLSSSVLGKKLKFKKNSKKDGIPEK